MAATFELAKKTPKFNYFGCLVLALGLALMYVPSYFDVAKRFWSRDEESQGPIILTVVLWLLWRERSKLVRDNVPIRQRIAGICVFGLGLVLYAIGRSQEFFQFDLGSQTPILLGLALGLGGVSSLRRFLFPAIFLVFVVPIPPSLLDQILVPLKITVSEVVTDGLFSLGYPISRSGVMLVVGQYQLLIADACSGLNSMIALSGVGLLYVHLLGRDMWVVNGGLLLAAVPIAFLANILRVATLVLITYYFGATAGTEFHDLAGYFEIAFAFLTFFVLDAVLVRVTRLGVRLHSRSNA